MIQVECTNLNDLVVNGLPDGSKVILDSKSEKVFALNPTAGAAWDACSGLRIQAIKSASACR